MDFWILPCLISMLPTANDSMLLCKMALLMLKFSLRLDMLEFCLGMIFLMSSLMDGMSIDSPLISIVWVGLVSYFIKKLLLWNLMGDMFIDSMILLLILRDLMWIWSFWVLCALVFSSRFW